MAAKRGWFPPGFPARTQAAYKSLMVGKSAIVFSSFSICRIHPETRPSWPDQKIPSSVFGFFPHPQGHVPCFSAASVVLVGDSLSMIDSLYY